MLAYLLEVLVEGVIEFTGATLPEIIRDDIVLGPI